MRARHWSFPVLLSLLATACPFPTDDDPGVEESSSTSGGPGSSTSEGNSTSSGTSSSSNGGGSSSTSTSSGAVSSSSSSGGRDGGIVVEGNDAGVVEGPIDAGAGVPNQGWIGGACQSTADCTYADSRCLTEAEGFPGGTCSQSCDLYCPDLDGPNSVTFCVDAPSGVSASAGICVSRCDYGLYPGTGCREGYGCQELSRHNQPETVRYACLPGEPDPQGTCLQELLAAGVPFEPTTHTDTHPDGHPELTCHIEDPVRVTGPIRGIPFRYTSNSTATPMLMSCALALALDKFAAILVESQVTEVEHLGVYNCRVISGTSSLSEHGLGTAIDLAAFNFVDGSRWTVNDDFEEGTNPTTAAGQWMWDLVNQLYDERVFHIILTPNYNAAHRNHFHVDLTEGAHFLRYQPGQLRIRDEDDHGPLRILAPNLSGD
ncbi:MAG: extensin family protein [Myxococcota bacterium]